MEPGVEPGRDLRYKKRCYNRHCAESVCTGLCASLLRPLYCIWCCVARRRSELLSVHNTKVRRPEIAIAGAGNDLCRPSFFPADQNEDTERLSRRETRLGGTCPIDSECCESTRSCESANHEHGMSELPVFLASCAKEEPSVRYSSPGPRQTQRIPKAVKG